MLRSYKHTLSRYYVWRNSVETAFKLTKFRGVSGLFCSGCLEAASADILHWTDSHATCQQVTPRHTHVAETRGPATHTSRNTGLNIRLCFTLSAACFSELEAVAVTGQWSVGRTVACVFVRRIIIQLSWWLHINEKKSKELLERIFK